MEAHIVRNNRVIGWGSVRQDVTTPAHWVVSAVFRGTQTLSRWMTLGKIKDEEQVTEIPSYLFWSGCCYTAFAGLIVFIH